MKRIITTLLLLVMLLLTVEAAFADHIHDLARTGNLSELKRLIRRTHRSLVEALVNKKDKDGNTPLHLAAREGRRQVVYYLINKGSIINERNKKGETPLQFMAEKGYVEVGGRIYVSTIHEAAKKGNYSKVRSLLYKNPKIVNSIDGDHMTPLHWAAWKGHVKTASLLISKGAIVNARNNANATPLILAVYSGNVKMVKLLMSNGADPNVRTANFHTALQFARGEIADILRGKSGTSSRRTAAKRTVTRKVQDDRKSFFKAIEKGDYYKVKKLLHINPKLINSVDGDNTSLHHAAHFGYVKIATLLISKGININVRDGRGDTPLHEATRYRKVNVVRLLLSKGANVNVKNMNRETPLSIALRIAECYKQGLMADLLRKHGARE